MLLKSYKFLAVLLLFFISGCVSYNIQPQRPNELGLDTSYKDKVFSIDCTGDEFGSKKYVDQTCRTYIAEFAYNNGYNYFTILDKDDNQQTSMRVYATRTSVSAYSTQEYSKYYLFILINDNEINNYNNYYIVADYYTKDTYKSKRRRDIIDERISKSKKYER
ncbi:MAG: hypothetical protein LBH40_00200 [Alphaproteobacteria bacterium]|jgi:hypothetical protein|nr:hypothetical protein [Alphaproteobacteria bacterium]